ncbi:unnamed protein product, partial [marine sediment metagenome]
PKKRRPDESCLTRRVRALEIKNRELKSAHREDGAEITRLRGELEYLKKRPTVKVINDTCGHGAPPPLIPLTAKDAVEVRIECFRCGRNCTGVRLGDTTKYKCPNCNASSKTEDKSGAPKDHERAHLHQRVLAEIQKMKDTNEHCKRIEKKSLQAFLDEKGIEIPPEEIDTLMKAITAVDDHIEKTQADEDTITHEPYEDDEEDLDLEEDDDDFDLDIDDEDEPEVDEGE